MITDEEQTSKMHIFEKGLRTQKDLKQNSQNIQKKENKPAKIYLMLGVLIVTILIGSTFKLRSSKVKSVQTPVDQTLTKQLQDFPKILWIYSDNEFASLGLVDSSMANYYIDEAQKSNFTVRLVNHTSAYEWLSEKMILKITQARQIVRLDLEMEDLLVIALLIENGGVLIRHFDTLLSIGFQWITEAFESTDSDEWNCLSEMSSILLLSENKDFSNFPRYSDSLIAARPQSQLLRQVLETYIKISTTEPDIRDIHGQVLELDNKTRAYRAPELVQFCLSTFISDATRKIIKTRKQSNQTILSNDKSLCKALGFQTSKFNDPIIDAKNIQEYTLRKFISQTEKKDCQRRVRVLIQVDKNLLKSLLARTLRIQKNQFSDGSFINNIVSAKGNKELFLEPLPERSIQFCIILMQEMQIEEIVQTVQQLSKQTYSNWSVVFPVKNIEDVKNKNIQQFRAKIKLLKSTGSKGHNIEQAITRFCPHNSHALLLNSGQKLSSFQTLEELSISLKPRDVLGCLVVLEVDGNQLIPTRANRRFHRKIDGIVNPDLETMKNMSNHLRSFAVEVYKFLPQLDMRDPYGNYYDDRLIFIMSFYDMVRDSFDDDDQKVFIVRKYAHKFNIPQKIAFSKTVSIITNQIDEVDKIQLEKTFTRIDVQSFSVVLGDLIQERISFDKMLAFNQGKPYQNFITKEGPLLNEAIIHQAWLGGALPPVKKYLFDKTSKMFSNFQMKLWTFQNITQDNFPISYPYMKTLCQFNRNSPYNKFAVITDMLRHEVLYKYGGFWRDSTLSIMKPYLNHFRKYRLTLPVDKTLRYRYLQGMCFYGHVKHYQPALRIISYKNLNRMRMYKSYALSIAGPIDFRKLVDRDQQYDAENLILAYETFYPGQLYQHPSGDLCVEPVSRPPENYQTVQKGYGALKNCSEIYPYAFGIQHNNFGSTWNYPQILRYPRSCLIK